MTIKRPTTLPVVLFCFFLLISYIQCHLHISTHNQSNNNNEHHRPYHKCIHDEIIEKETKTITTEKSSTYLNHLLKQELFSTIPTKFNLKRNRNTKKIEKVFDIFNNIRITFDTRYIPQDMNQKSCYKVGDPYVTGSPSSTSVKCSSTIQSDCYGTCNAAQVLTTNKQNVVINTILPKIKEKLQKQLLTRPLLLFRSNLGQCGTNGDYVDFPSNLITTGVTNTDLYIFVTMRPTLDDVVAYALPCLRESQFGRPIAGLININPVMLDDASISALQSDNSYQQIQFVNTLEHEVTHVLGLTSSFYDRQFVDANGNRLDQSKIIQTRSITYNGQTQNRMFFIHDTMLNTLRNFTNCNSNLYGVPIEEKGGSGSAGSHFDSRTFINELMSPSLDGCVSYSRGCNANLFTFSFLEMTGWYKMDWNYVIEPIFGKGLGCQFVNNRCSEWNVGNRKGYFCNDQSKKLSCVYHLRDKGVCDLQQFTNSLDGFYRYFSDPTLGGRIPWFDYCPYNRNKIMCNDKTQSKRSAEVFNSNSACFEGNLEAPGYSGSLESEETSRCLNYHCDRINKLLRIRLHTTNKYITCPKDQSYHKVTTGSTELQGFKGTISCPENGYNILCESKEIPSSVDDGTGNTVIDPSEAGNGSGNSGGGDSGRSCFLIFCWGNDASSQFNSAQWKIIGLTTTAFYLGAMYFI
ncbi:hypothetical protein ABK040_005277 [Willaertia magna]